MKKEVIWRYTGIDESNNGRHPTIYIAALSSNPQDVAISADLLPKLRKHLHIGDRLKGREYSFLLLNSSELLIEPYKKIGVVIASLLHGDNLGETLDVYIDGEWSRPVIDFAKGALEEATGLEKDLIIIHTGKDLDRKMKIVNLADELAHWFLRKRLNSLQEDPRKKELLTDLLKL